METLTVIPEEEDLPEDLKAILTEAEVKRNRGRRHFNFFTKLCYCCFSLILLIMLIAKGLPLNLSLILIPIVPLYICIIYHFCQRKKGFYGLAGQAIERLAHSKDKRVIGVLLDSLVHFNNYNPPVQRKYPLQPLLPLLNADNVSLLTKEQKTTLTSLLNNSEEEFMFTVFSALEQIGDTDQLPSLKGWKRLQTGMCVKPETLAAYKSCLAAIEARAASSRSNSQLLRPSFPTKGANTYLRPVTQKMDENAETLLRSDLTPDFAHSDPLPVPSCLGEEGETHEETVGENRTEEKS